MRYAVASIVIAFAFAPQAFALLRPLFPVKPEPPFSGEVIVILDDLVRKTNPAVADARVIDRATNQDCGSTFLLFGMGDVSRPLSTAHGQTRLLPPRIATTESVSSCAADEKLTAFLELKAAIWTHSLGRTYE